MYEEVDVSAFSWAMKRILQRYPNLRVHLHFGGDGEPVQVINHKVRCSITQRNWCRFSDTHKAKKFDEFLRTDSQQSFDLEQSPLMRFTLFRLAEAHYQFVWTSHHLLFDGRSRVMILKELWALYQAKKNGNELELPAPTPYLTFLNWLETQNLDSQENFWRETLGKIEGPTPLAIDLPGSRKHVHEGIGTYTLSCSETLTAQLSRLAGATKTTLNTILIGTWALILSRYTGESDVVFGVTRTGRSCPVEGLENMVGLCINTLPMRVSITRHEEVSAWLRKVRAQWIAVGPFEQTSLTNIQEWSGITKGEPLFESLVVFEHRTLDATLRLEQHDWPNWLFHVEGMTNYPLVISGRGGTHLTVDFTYHRHRFAPESIERLAGHFQKVLETLATQPQQTLEEISILSPREHHQLIVDWNRTYSAYPKDSCIHKLFEAQVLRTPDAVAVECNGMHLSYNELDRLANRLARHLRETGVSSETRVGLLMERSPELVVGLLGILKAGGTYIPLDPAYPEERIRYMLNDSQAAVLVTHAASQQIVSSDSIPLVHIDNIGVCCETEGNLRIRPSHPDGSAKNLAYILYTSGSTGRPKGVAIEHGNVVNFLHWFNRHFSPMEYEAVLASTSICFDLSVFELFGPLSWGGTVVLAKNALHLQGLPAADRVTLVNTVPSAMLALLQADAIPSSVKVINLAGELLTPDLVTSLYQQTRVNKVYDLYGPSEATTYSTGALRHPHAPGTIGRPLPNTQAYVLDAGQRPVPVQIPGELYIGGDGLARGYWQQPGLTAEKFVPDFFGLNPGARLYRTGDLVRQRTTGELEFLGRIDHQVKVRGHRIELGEIQEILSQHAHVRESVVIVRSDVSPDPELVAYVVATQEKENDATRSINQESLQEFLRKQLPSFMIPGIFVFLDALPLTPNGKIDRTALPIPSVHHTPETHHYIAPRTRTEFLLAEIWEQVLRVKQIGITDNFFSLGGHSLLAMQVVVRVRTVLNVELPLQILFDTPTIAAVAEVISHLNPEVADETVPILGSLPRPEPIPLSYAQERLWFLDRWEPNSPLYNMAVAYRVHGSIHMEMWEQALRTLVKRHETLRTTFVEREGVPTQTIHHEISIPLTRIDLSEEDLARRAQQATEEVFAESRRPFDLAVGPLVRSTLITLDENEHLFLLTLHHIISDGWSLELLFREFLLCYQAALMKQIPRLAPLRLQYADFAIWQREWLQGKRLNEHLVYWRNQLTGAPPMLPVPGDFPRPSAPSYQGRRHPVAFSAELAHALHEMSEREGVTLFMVMLAAFQVLLARYTGQFDVVVGTPIANRSHEELERVHGFFANTLVLRTDLSGHPTFQDVIRRVRNVCLGAYAHQDVPFEKLVEELQPERDLSRNPFFQVMFQLYTPHDPGITLPNLTVSRQILDSGTAKFDLLFSLGDRGTDLYGGVEYATDIFEEATITRLIGHYQRLLEEIIADPTRRIDQLPFLTAAEESQLLVQWNATTVSFPQNSCVHGLVEEQARHTPDSIAVVFDEQAVTYSQLDHQANALARHLQDLGVGPDIRVGVCVERSIDMVVTVLAVLKAGGAYVPLDPTYPQARLTFMLTNAEVPVLVTQRHFHDLFVGSTAYRVLVDEDLPPVRDAEKQAGQIRVSPNNLAYVIYTSGSTGQPKGVAMTHQAIVNLLAWQRRHTTVHRQARTLQFTSLNFDVSVQEIFSTLGVGGTLVLVSEAQRREPVDLLKVLMAARVERLFVPVVALNQLAEVAESWEMFPTGVREIITAGEALQITPALRRFVEKLPHCTLHNQYGPTETHVSTALTLEGPCKDWPARPPIGRPIANEEGYILDKFLQPVPIGVAGELYVGGVGLARGYVNRTDLTAERFIPNPFGHNGGERLYKTGDVVRYRSNGIMEFIGRIDHQIKLRGYRIEVGEIEVGLEQHPDVSKAVVVMHEAEGHQQLVAYVVPTPTTATVDQTELHRFLDARMPAYMVPSTWVQLDALPLTPNGKIDRRALPAPTRVTLQSNHFVPPETHKEEQLAEIWKEVLKVEQVGRHDNFFTLGGHSLLAMILISRVRKVLGIELSIRTLFEAPTIADLSVEVRKRTSKELGKILSTSSGEDRPLSFAQHRLWFLEQWEPHSALYNVPSVFRLRGSLHVDAFRNALRALVGRHDSLRTIFRVVDDRPCQHIQRVEDLTCPCLAFLEIPDEAGEPRDATLLRMIAEETHRPFDLTRGPLVRAHLLPVAETEAIFILTMHHIITDGWSMEIFLKELSVLYAAEIAGTPANLPVLPIQYADYAVWQRNWLQGNVLAEQVTYWRRQLDGAPPVLELPSDYPRPVVPSYRGAKHRFTFSLDLTQSLHTLTHQYGVSLFMTLLAAFQVFLARYTGQTDIVVGSPMANRTLQESEGLIGFLVNTLLFRTRLGGNPTFAEVLGRVKEVCLDAYAHQDLPFEKLVEELQPERDPSRNPLFQVMMQLQKQDVQALQLPGLKIERMPNMGGLAKFDLNVTFVEDGEDLKGVVDYRTDLFAASTITRMMEHFHTLVKAVVANPEQPVFAVELLTEAERRQQLVDWNAPTTTYPAESCVHHLFEAQVARTPEAVAVVFESHVLTYQELNSKANRLAQRLQQQGVLRGDMVPIVMERSVELIISYFAIMKMGAAFSPLAPEWPPDRLRTLLTQLSSHVVLTNQDPLVLKNLCDGKVVMKVDASTLAALPENLHIPVQPEDPVYVLFTSGSTGIPKGAINHHRGLVNRLWNMQQRYSWSEDDVVLVTLRHTFDASLWQYLWPLTHGARLVLPPPSPWLDMFLIMQLMEQERVTLSGFVPSVFALFVDEVDQQPMLRNRLGSLRHLLIGGEALHAAPVNQFFACCPKVRITNAYGPTEASISTIYYDVPDPCVDPIPLGRPLKNVKAVILDDQLHLVPVGVPGELHLGGVCVGLGYLHNPEATQAAFIPNPFPELKTSILYKTGDRACFQQDGTIRYLGRRDHQVKINGIRMELGEIEVVLRRHPKVKQAVVLPWATPSGGNRLVAYVASTQTKASFENSEITSFLSRYLPTYMIPSTFVRLEQLPLLPNGKINRHELPPPQLSSGQSEEFISPQTPQEERLARIFSEVLRVEAVGRHDNFFALGGHSLLAMMMVSRIQKIFGITVGVRVLFDHPTIADLAMHLAAQTDKPIEPDLAPRTQDRALPLSFAQQRLWFLDQWEPDSPLYNIPKVFRLIGALNIQALHQALALLVTRHETLRTTFTSVNGTPYQVISKDTKANVVFHDLKEWSLATPQDRARELADQEAEKPFQLHHGPLFRVMLLRLSDQEHWLCLTFHHIIADGWSMEILWRELGELYEDCLNGRTPDLPPLALQYADFAIWEREWSQGVECEKQRAYWRQQLQNVPTVLELPTDYPRPMRQSYRGGHQRFTIPALLTSKLKTLSQREGLTMFMLLIGAFQVLLYRYSGQRDMVVGTPVARRPLDGVEGLIGLFINTLLIRTQFDGNPTFRNVSAGVKETCLDAYANRDLPFENLIEELQSNRDPSRNPLFQVLFHLYTPLDNLQRFPGLAVSEEAVYRGTAKVDLAMTLTDSGSSIQGSIEYATDLFEAKTIQRFIDHFVVLLEEIVQNPGQGIETLPLLPQAEEEQLLRAWNMTAKDYPRDTCLHDLVQRQALSTPETIALVCEEHQLTYRELTRRATQLANYLFSLGVGPEVRVGLCHERAPELIIGMLGIMQAGGAYVPLDPTYPIDRLRFMLQDSQIGIVVIQEKLEPLFPQESLIQVCLDRDWSIISNQPETKPTQLLTANTLAYVLYTSGSTGRPKGVQIAHREVVNFLIDTDRKLKGTAPLVLLATTSFSFDISILELFWPLIFGGRVILASQPQVRDGHHLVERLFCESVTMMNATPAGWRLLLEANWKGKSDLVMLTGGEALPEELANQLLQRGGTLWNLYGPTETTIYSTCTQILPSEKMQITIGSPIANTQTYILDTKFQPVPIGVPGELFIGGDGLSRGYLHRPDLTAERFVPDPFSRSRGKRLYRTGDRARYRDTGKIEWLGRLDHQVKLRGFRIETREIEAALIKWPTLAQAVVIIREDFPGMTYLVAYYQVLTSQAPPSVEELKFLVRQQLPEYMVPNLFVRLEKFPLTPNGKIDRSGLAAPEIPGEVTENFEPPRTIEEKVLAGIFAEVLNVKEVGRQGNFFELGGNSLMAMQLISRVRKAFSIGIFVRTLFEFPTLSAFAAALNQLKELQVKLHADPISSDASNDPGKQAPTKSYGNSDFPKPDTPLICLQPQGAMPALFCVHPIGGGITCYQKLVRYLGKEHPVYALQAIDFIPALGHDPSLEEFARYYIQSIQSLDPLGPYHLCGWSMGGVIAFEMARQLGEMGQPVQLLTLIESFLPQRNVSPATTDHSTTLRQFWRNLTHGENINLVELSIKTGFPHSCQDAMLEILLDFGLQRKLLPVGMKLSYLKQLWHVFRSLRKALDEYVPKPYSGKLGLFQANAHRSEINKQAQKDWEGVTQGGVEVYQIPGNHYSIFESPHIEILASHVNTWLARVTSDSCDEHPESRPHTSENNLNAPSSAIGPSHTKMPIAHLLKDLPQEFRVEHRPLSTLIEEGKIPPIDSVALYYLPDQYLHESGLTRDAVIHGWYHNQPTLTHILDTSIGRIGTLMLPLTGIELYSEQKRLLELCRRGLEIATQAGATTASLTGLLPSATDYGHAIQQAIEKRGDLPKITTGHGTTAATVVLAIRKILEASQRDIQSECVGFLGLGSIGLASLRLTLSCLPHPEELLLCDVYHRKDALKAIRQEVLTTYGFQGKVRLIESTGVVPKAFYESRLIIGATNVPDVLDVERLQPGTLIVDDSGPHCFRVAKAIERSMSQYDILFTEGGILRSPTVIPCLRYLPLHAMEHMTPGLAKLFSRFHPWRITGCVLASILLAKVPDQKPVFGLVDVQTGVDNFHILLKLGYEAAELNCEGYTLPPSLIEKVATQQ